MLSFGCLHKDTGRNIFYRNIYFTATQLSEFLNQTDIFSGILLKKPSNWVNISLKNGITEAKPSIALGPHGWIKE